MQQSRSSFDIMRHDNGHASKLGNSEGYSQQHDRQAGDDWTCMWLNHSNREQKRVDLRNSRYQMNTQRIFNNPEQFGTGNNDVSESRKQHMQTLQLHGGFGNTFAEHMSGDPIQKVFKLRQKKRDKLKKYLMNHPMAPSDQNNPKSQLQNKNGVSLTTTPDYNFYKVLNPKRMSFKNEIMNQIRSNQTREVRNAKINKEDDVRTCNLYEKKIKIIEHLEQANRDKVKKSLLNDINWQIRDNMRRSFQG
jgi:hypothetical protein